MFTKALLATSALIVASSMAFAHAQAPTKQQAIQNTLKLQRQALAAKGIITNKQGAQIAVRAMGKSNGVGSAAKFIPNATSGNYSNFGKSKNALFISWFGWFAGGTSGASNFSGSFCYSYSANGACINHYKYHDQASYTISQSAAQPFKAHGGSATSISVGAAQYSGSGGMKIALYTNKVATSTSPCGTVVGFSSSAAASCPGTKLASATFSSPPAYTGLCCSGLDTVSIAATKLAKHKQYWVVLSRNGSNKGRIAWNGQASNWTAYPGGEGYNDRYKDKIDDTYHTTARDTYKGTYKTTINQNTQGWVHALSFTYEAQPGAFSVN